MPTHAHTVTLEAMLGETERLLVRWLLLELNAIRSELGMAEVTIEGLDAVRREGRTQQQQTLTQEGPP